VSVGPDTSGRSDRSGRSANLAKSASPSLDGIDVQPAIGPSESRAWTKIFSKASQISSEHAALVQKIVDMPQGLSLVARANHRPVGCLTLAIEGDLAIVHNVGILPSARRLGVGRRLLLSAHEAATARGMRACVVLATPEGSGVCARLGHHAVTSLTYLMPPQRAAWSPA
jgi:GNAT superfamily N-acetyltransferase